MTRRQTRKISAGTWAMLIVTVLVLTATVFVLARLSSGKTSDLTRLQPVTAAIGQRESESVTAKATEHVLPQTTASLSAAEKIPEMTEQPGKTFTIVAGGTVSLAGEIRSNSYYSDVKQYDYYDIMSLLRRDLQADLSIVFLENILSTEQKATDIIASGAAVSMLKAAGVDAAACGFSRAFDKAEAGVLSTRKLLTEYGIRPVGIYEGDGTESARFMEINGIRIAVLQYTDTIAAAARKSMVKNGQNVMVPPADPDGIAADITKAREQACDAVVVLLHWGKTGKAPDKDQRTLAQKIADAGADLIIGCGSRIVSGADMLTAAENGKSVLCVWSLGTVLSGDRSNIRRIAGILLHITLFTKDGKTEIRDCSYTPLYTWKYKMDGRYYYRCLAANGTVPDGMDTDQQKSMKKAADVVREAMKNSGMEEHRVE